MSGGSGAARGPWRAVVSMLVLAAAVVLLARALGPEGLRDLGQRLRASDPALLAMAALVNLARYGLWALRWQMMVRPVARMSWWIAFRSLMVSVFLNTVVPAARPLGGIIRARLAARHTGGAGGPLYGGTLVDQFGYTVVSALVGAACLPLAFSRGGGRGLSGPLPWLVGGVALAVAGSLLHPRVRARLAAWIDRRLPAARETLAGATRASRELLARPATYLLMVPGGVLVWLLNALVLWIAGHATGVPFSPRAAAAAWAVGSLAGAVSGTPGGAGTTEGAAIVPLLREGLEPADALAAVVLARGLHYISALILGGACFLARPGGRGPLTRPPESS